MEIKVSATGTVSAQPDRVVISMFIRATEKLLETAKGNQAFRLGKIVSVLKDAGVEFKYLSSPSVQEVTHREEDTVSEPGKKLTKWVKDGYRYFQTAEIHLEGWEIFDVSVLMEALTSVTECSLSSRFELTEEQRSVLSEQAMEKSYNLALRYATKMYNLEKARGAKGFEENALTLKEVTIAANDYGYDCAGDREFGAVKGMSFKQSEVAVNETLPVRKPIKVYNTVEYIFETEG